MITGFNFEIDFNDEAYTFDDGDLIVVTVEENEVDDLDVFAGELIGCIMSEDAHWFILDSIKGIIKINTLDITCMDVFKGVCHLSCRSYKEM